MATDVSVKICNNAKTHRLKKIAKDCHYSCLNRITGKVFNHIKVMAASSKPRWKTLKRSLFPRSLFEM